MTDSLKKMLMEAHVDRESKSEDGLEARIRFLQHQVREEWMVIHTHAYHMLTEQTREDQAAERDINKTTTIMTISFLFTNK